MRPLLAALLLVPALGAAQTLAITINGAVTSGTNLTPVLAFNASGCGNTINGSWTGSGLTTACTSLQIWVTAFTCGIAPSTTNVPADFIASTTQAGDLANGTTTVNFSFTASQLPSLTSVSSDGGTTTPCGSVVDISNTVCGSVTLNTSDNGCTGTQVNSPAVTLRYDNVPPDAPNVTIVPLDSQLSVRLSPDALTPVADILYYRVQYALQPDGGTPGSYTPVGGNIAASNAAVTISNLVNGELYSIQAFTVDEASNVSTTPTTVTGSPVMTTGFYANYLNDGGQPGGCGDTGGGGPSALAFTVLVLMAVVRRRG